MSTIEAGRYWLARRRRGRPDSVHRTYGAASSNVTAARAFARSTAAQWNIDPHGVETVVGELAKNAVQHTGTPFTLTLVLSGRTVRVEVADRSRAKPYFEDTALFSEGGRGLVIVEQAAIRWGYRLAESGGKVVWADVGV